MYRIIGWRKIVDGICYFVIRNNKFNLSLTSFFTSKNVSILWLHILLWVMLAYKFTYDDKKYLLYDVVEGFFIAAFIYKVPIHRLFTQHYNKSFFFWMKFIDCELVWTIFSFPVISMVARRRFVRKSIQMIRISRGIVKIHIDILVQNVIWSLLWT